MAVMVIQKSTSRWSSQTCSDDMLQHGMFEGPTTQSEADMAFSLDKRQDCSKQGDGSPPKWTPSGERDGFSIWVDNIEL